MKNISIVRDRGQLTVPDNIRKQLSWINPDNAVVFTIVKPDEVVIKPHKVEIDWDHLWGNLKKSRSTKGKDDGKISTVDFINQDRHSH